MADIRQYLREKEKREQNQVDYRSKILKHRMTTVYRIGLIVAIALAVMLLVYIQYQRQVYTRYDVVDTVKREAGSEAIDMRLGNAILTYSKDGAHCTDAKGNVTWNQTYEIQDIKLASCKDVVAIANYNGRNIYVGNTQEQMGTITTNMPIRNLAVAANGQVTAVLADTDVTWVNTYNADGENIYSGQTHMSNSGYPGAVSLSPSGELLAVSYVYVDAGSIKTNVAFYNFGPIGENQSDHMVSVFIYTDMLVPMIHFMNDETAFAVGDGRLMIYRGAHIPTLAGEYILDEEIQSVYYSDKYIGLVFLSDDGEHRYRLNVYDENAVKIGTYYFDMEYNDIFFDKETFVIYNEQECMVSTMNGLEKFKGSFNRGVKLLLPTTSAYRYICVTDDSFDTLQLR